MTDEGFRSWAVLELLGHRRLAGYVTAESLGGASFLRIDVPTLTTDLAVATTQYYSPSSVYCLTPCSEEVARAVAKRNQPEPVHYFELPRPSEEADAAFDDDDEEAEGDR